MNYTEQFINDIKIGIIPEYPPREFLDRPWDDRLPFINDDGPLDSFKARQECTTRGMWAIIDKQWTKKLAKWIGNRKCLEVMSGAGWLAKALSIHGIDIVATDNFSWENAQHKEMTVVYDVENISGIQAVKKYNDKEVLIISWPPYDHGEICKICDKWGPI